MSAVRDIRENVRIWLEKGPNSEQWVYVETRHARRVLELDEFVSLVKNKLGERRGIGCIFSRTGALSSNLVNILRLR